MNRIRNLLIYIPVIKLSLDRSDNDWEISPNLVHTKQKHGYAGCSDLKNMIFVIMNLILIS